MATRTDLNGYLRDDDESLALRFEEYFNAEGTTGPITVKVKWAPVRGATLQTIGDLTVQTVSTNAIENLIEQIAERIITRLGPAPEGIIQTQAYGKGESRKPPLLFTRTLRGFTAEDGDSPNIALLKHRAQRAEVMADRALATAEIAMGHMVANNGHLSAIISTQNQTIGTLATARTPTTAAGELNGPWAILGFLAVLWFWPHIKARLGLPQDASFTDVLDRASKVVSMSFANPQTPPMPPPGAMRPVEPGPEAPPENGQDGPGLLTADHEINSDSELMERLIRRMVDDEGFRAEAIAKVKAEPVLVAEALKP